VCVWLGIATVVVCQDWCVCVSVSRPGADDVLVLRQDLVKTQTLMDAVNQEHDKEREHLTCELNDVKHKLHLYVLDLDLVSDLSATAVCT